MKKYFLYISIISSIFSQDEKLAVSILDFTGEDVRPKVLKACFQRLETSLIDSDQFIVIEKSEREEILKEQQIQSSGICDTDCVVDIGQLLGAEYLMLGEIINLGNELYQINVKIINVEKGDVTKKVTQEVEGSTKDLLNAMESASDQIIRRISVNKANLNQLLNGEYEIAEKKFGKISIYSEPSNAIILIDNDKIGLTPVKNIDLKVGTRNLKIIKKGFVTINKGLKVLETENASINEVLMMKTGGINISSKPKGSKIYLNNKYVGISPINIPEIIIGEHQIRVSNKDYDPENMNIIIEYDKIKDIDVNLIPKLGTINIVTDISDANISINNKKYKTDPSGFTPIKLKPGNYEINIWKTGYTSEFRKIKIDPNQSETIEIEMYLVKKIIDNKNLEKVSKKLFKKSKRAQKVAWVHRNDYVHIDDNIIQIHNFRNAIIRSSPSDNGERIGTALKGTKLKIIKSTRLFEHSFIMISYSNDIRRKSRINSIVNGQTAAFNAALIAGIIWMISIRK